MKTKLAHLFVVTTLMASLFGVALPVMAPEGDKAGSRAWPGDPTVNVLIGAGNNTQWFWYPQICSDGAGGAIITWLSLTNGGNPSYVYAQRVNAAGAVVWTANGTAICPTGNCSAPQICSDGAGGAIVTWSD